MTLEPALSNSPANSPATMRAAAPRPFAVVDEAPADALARESLLDAAFGPARFLKTCERLREGRRPAPGLALVTKDEEGELLATLRLWPIFAGARRPALLLGPLAVAEHARSLGLGGEMIRVALARAMTLGHRAVLLVGDSPYYARFSFERRFSEKLVMPGPVEAARFLGRELVEGALAGAHGRVSAAPAVARFELPRAA
jgi:predicted N-acetyltransferase YhbS